MNYSQKLKRLQERQQPDYKQYSLDKAFSAEDYKSEIEEAQEYVTRAMEELPARSTEISYQEGNRVKQHLKEELPNYGFNPDFEYQGSVPCNTHIKFHSDIDLLVIIDKFETVENSARIRNRYTGDPKEDLARLRAACIKILKENYTVADIEKNSKSIKISGGSLRRQIDVVPANWYNSENWYNYNLDYYRGIQIFDSKTKERYKNFPFLNIHLIDEKDRQTCGLYRPLVRLAKTLKEDSESNINISSYDIQALLYNMDNSNFFQNVKDTLIYTTDYLYKTVQNPYKYQSLVVPDGTRRIAEKVDINEVKKLFNEFYTLSNELGII